MNTYFNTTGAQGATLATYKIKAKSQQQLILEYFESMPGMRKSPSQVQRGLNLTGAPLTSIRRALTNLTTDGKLVKTSRLVKGEYGRLEHTWTLCRSLTIQSELQL